MQIIKFIGLMFGWSLYGLIPLSVGALVTYATYAEVCHPLDAVALGFVSLLASGVLSGVMLATRVIVIGFISEQWERCSPSKPTEAKEPFPSDWR